MLCRMEIITKILLIDISFDNGKKAKTYLVCNDESHLLIKKIRIKIILNLKFILLNYTN